MTNLKSSNSDIKSIGAVEEERLPTALAKDMLASFAKLDLKALLK